MMPPNFDRLVILQQEVKERIKEFDAIRTTIAQELEKEYVGKLVKFPGKGWAVGCVQKIIIHPLTVIGSSPPPTIVAVVGPKKNSQRSQCRYADIKDIEFLTEEEIKEKERISSIHKRSGGSDD